MDFLCRVNLQYVFTYFTPDIPDQIKGMTVIQTCGQ